jgi:hypothetical protein
MTSHTDDDRFEVDDGEDFNMMEDYDPTCPTDYEDEWTGADDDDLLWEDLSTDE